MDQKSIELIVRKVIEGMGGQMSHTPASIPIGVSARHIHLSHEHVETLFGKGHKLTPVKELMGGQYAAAEQVTIVGPKLRTIENVRVLGPVRKQTQIEVSTTDAVKLGISPPLRESGDLKGSAPITVAGPKGAVYLDEGCIIASRHIHMSPSDAAAADVKDGDMISIKTEGPRGATLDNVKIRVDSTYTLEMHIDTDEANACGIRTGDVVTLGSRFGG